MKLSEAQLDNVLAHHAVDERVHIIHDKGRRFTVAYVITGQVDDDQMQGLAINAAIARRNPDDNFDRRIGRLVSKGRLVDGKNATALLNQNTGSDLPFTSSEWRALDTFVVESLKEN